MSPADAQYALVPLAVRTLLAVLFLYIYRRKREPYLIYWAGGWTLLALHLLPELGVVAAEPYSFPQAVDSLLLAFGLLLFVDSARVFSRGASTPAVTALFAPVFVVWAILGGGPEKLLGWVPLEVGSGAVAGVAGLMFWSDSRRREVVGGTLLGLAFLLWGLELATAPFAPSWAAQRSLLLDFVVSLPRQLVAFGMLIVLYEEEKRTLERHMLSLAGLNLITSTAPHGSTLQEMLGQTLERLLGALRVPAGTMAVQLTEDPAKLNCIHRGSGGTFLRELENIGLLPYLQRMVTRLGGLVVLPEVHNPALPAAFALDEEFARVARQARAEGARLLVGVTLRAKSGSTGLLLLASPDSRHFSPAELRLLLGLGGQIGMAVENFHLMQQSARRAEELRLLNEIGRALSTTRNVDELLERIHAEMQKVLDVRNFYIALYDPQKEEVSFELEVKDGVFLPKRRRRARKGLTEYILRRKEPLLIGEDFGGTAARLGLEPTRRAMSFCAVPILLHGEAVGVIGIVSYTQEKAFDHEHVEVLTILAAQAAVAIENARLYREALERAKLDQELRVAAAIQRSLLPPAHRSGRFFSTAGTSVPCRSVGGDFFDYVDLSSGQFGFILGDVAGKGAPAALLAAAVIGMFGAEASYQLGAAPLVARLNQGLFRRGIEARFLTAFYGMIGADGTLTYSNAGHNPPLLVSAHGVRRLETGGLVLGLFADAVWEQEDVALSPGDVIVAFSDGVSEALNEANEEYTDDRLIACVQAHRDHPPQALLDGVVADLRRFCGAATPNDDVTLVVVRYEGMT